MAAFFYAREIDRRFLENEYGDLLFLTRILKQRSNSFYKMNTDQFLCLKINYHRKRVLCQHLANRRKGIIKELCGKYKAFLLSNEYDDPPFLFQNLGSLMIINQ